MEKGYDAKHDDSLAFCSLRQAATAYLFAPAIRTHFMPDGTPCPWPWGPAKWKPSPDNRVRELTRAGALFLADADRSEREGNGEAVRILRANAVRCAAIIDNGCPDAACQDNLWAPSLEELYDAAATRGIVHVVVRDVPRPQ